MQQYCPSTCRARVLHEICLSPAFSPPAAAHPLHRADARLRRPAHELRAAPGRLLQHVLTNGLSVVFGVNLHISPKSAAGPV